MLVTIAEARDHLRVDTTAHDSWLQIFIPAVENAVFTWLKEDWRAYVPMEDSNGDPLEDSTGAQIPSVDSNGQPIPKPVVKAAVLVELAQQDRFRDGSGAGVVPSHWGHGYVLGAGATSLLSGLRRSTVR